jgi:hypothetical protein
MGQISIDTPQGTKTGRIAGDVPTEDELNRIKQMFPATEGEPFDYSTVQQFGPDSPLMTPDEISQYGQPSVPQVAEPPPEPVGEVEDSWLRYQLARMDDDEEKQNLLNQLLGEGTSVRTAPDTFVIDQAKVDPRIREKYGLADTGTIYLDEPGFTWNDFIDFGGEAGPETLAAIGASIAFTGVGLIPGMLIVGAAAGLAKATDEAIEWAQGLNRQSAGEVAAMIGTSAISNAFFEGGGRVVAKVVGRLIKGPGPEISAQRIDDLAKGFEGLGVGARKARRLGRQAAREESLANMTAMIRGGARPTVEAAAGKGLSARALSIYEYLFKNPKVGEANFRYVKSVLKQVDEGILKEPQAVKLLTANNSDVAQSIARSLANPDEAFDLTKQHMDDIVKKALAEYEVKFVPSAKIPDNYADNLQLAATLFKTESGNLYDLASSTIGKSGIFDISPVLKKIDDLAADNPFVAYGGNLFTKMRQVAKEGGMSVGQLQQLKTALRIARGDTELVSSAAQGGINRILGSIDDLMRTKQAQLAEDVAKGFRIEKVPAGKPGLQETAFGPVFSSRKPGVTYRKVALNPSETENIRRGLDMWDEANRVYAAGQERFNNTAVNTILKSARDKYFLSDIDVLKSIVELGNAPKLSMYLDAVTPTLGMTQKLARPGATEAIENVRRLIDANQFKAAEEFVEQSGLKGVIPKIQGFIDDLPVEDVFRVSQKKRYMQQLDDLAQLSRGGTDPQAMRLSIRNRLAKTWIDQTREATTDSVKNFSPADFATRFTALGDDVQNALFGKANAKSMREAMEGFQLSATNKEAAQELFDALPTMMNQPLKARIQSMKEVFERAADESQDAVLSAINSRKITNPLQLVSGLLKNPASYQRLKAVVGDAELDKVGGVKDMVMNNLLHNGVKESLDAGTIQSGTWGASLKDAIAVQNKNGALNTILGVDTVKDLAKIADNAVKISNVPIKGFGALIQATLPLTLMALIFQGHIAAAAGTVTTMLVVSRMLRNRSILKLLTSTKARSAEYNKAIAAGADLPSLSALRAQGPAVYATNRMASIAVTETSLVAGSGIFGEMSGESQKDIREQYRQGAERVQRPPSAVDRGFMTQAEPILSYEAIIRSAAQSGNVPGAEGLLRDIELNKLRGVSASQ